MHRVVITAVLLAAKFFDDAYYNNAYYAKVGGVLVSEINGLEVDLLFRINFSLHVTPDEFDKYRWELLSHPVVPADLPAMEAYYAPALVSPEIHSAPGAMSADPIAAFGHPSQLTNAKSGSLQITPSPPTAAQMVEALANTVAPDCFHFHPDCRFPPMHRTTSMPPLHKGASPLYQQLPRVQPYTDPVHSRCAQPILGAMPQFPRQIYPLQGGNLVHHHHGTYAQGPIVEVAGYAAVTMSGVGL